MKTREMVLISTDIYNLENLLEAILIVANQNDMDMTIMEVKYALLFLMTSSKLTTYRINMDARKWKQTNGCETHILYITYSNINKHIQIAMLDLLNKEVIVNNGLKVKINHNKKLEKSTDITQVLRMMKVNPDLVKGDINEIM